MSVSPSPLDPPAPPLRFSILVRTPQVLIKSINKSGWGQPAVQDTGHKKVPPLPVDLMFDEGAIPYML